MKQHKFANRQQCNAKAAKAEAISSAFLVLGYSKLPAITLSFYVQRGAPVDKSGKHENRHQQSQDSMPTGQSPSS